MRNLAQIAPSHDAVHAPDDASARVQIAALSSRNYLRLKSWMSAQNRGAAVVEFAGVALPTSIGSTGAIGSAGQADSIAARGADTPVRILCLAPDEWLVVGDAAGSLEAHARAWSQGRATAGLAVVNMTDGIAALRIEGREARHVLSKGCGLDFHPRAFAPGTCARSLFAKTALVVDCVGPERFDLYIGRSYRAYLHAWLIDAAVGHGRIQ